MFLEPASCYFYMMIGLHYLAEKAYHYQETWQAYRGANCLLQDLCILHLPKDTPVLLVENSNRTHSAPLQCHYKLGQVADRLDP